MSPSKTLPSAGWSSYEPWTYNTDMPKRLRSFMDSTLDKQALVAHASEVMGESMKMSQPFLKGQYWCCFELVGSSGKLAIARVRLPRHPCNYAAVNEESELYSIECEVATMQFLRDQTPKFSVPIPEIYAYERPGSEKAAAVGAMYMLVEGFYGNTLEYMASNFSLLPEDTEAHIIKQWTTIQAELARLAFTSIGSICQYSKQHGPMIGKLSTAAIDGLSNPGPFGTKLEYFTAIAETKFRRASNEAKDDSDATSFLRLGLFIFKDIVENTPLFRAGNYDLPNPFFHFNNMDMGMQNILVDKDFNFLAIIDWKNAQSAPLEVNYFPMPFPLVESNAEILSKLKDPEHIEHESATNQSQSRRIYALGFELAEEKLCRERGAPAPARRNTWEISEVLGTTASRIYGAVEKLGVFHGWEEKLIYEMVRLAYGYEGEKAKEYLAKMEAKMGEL